MADAIQDFGSKVTYQDDWTKHLASVGRTITTATVTASNGATVTNVTPSSTGVAFRLDTTGVPSSAPTDVTVTTTATFDNGDVDVRHYQVHVTST